ncbi:MAG: glycosyltransferase [Eisenbergiella sp.]
MKIVQINTFPYKATGSIMMSIHNKLQEMDHESYVVWGRGRDAQGKQEIVIKDDFGMKLHGIYTRLTDRTGFASSKSTRKLLEKLEKIKPDLIHLHNIHGYYLNIELLFEYIKSHNIKVIWTLHDCWPFTGHCAYFDQVRCERWKTGCYKCPQKHTYPASKCLDNSRWNWERKKALFTGAEITLVTPCKWLKGIVELSFLKEYPVEVIYNGIDCDTYHPKETDFEKKYHLSEKYVILGVASEWTERKGLKDFIELSRMLDDKYKIVLVGLEKEQIKKLPNRMIGIERTSSVEELVGIYSRANVFFNPTYEDNFPTTNIEAIACQTPVITYNTGGSPEAIDSNTGYVVEKGNIREVFEIITSGEQLEIKNIRESFTKQKMISRYLELYERKK